MKLLQMTAASSELCTKSHRCCSVWSNNNKVHNISTCL